MDRSTEQKHGANRLKTGTNLNAMLSSTLIHLITSKLYQNIIKKMDQDIKSFIKDRLTDQKLYVIPM